MTGNIKIIKDNFSLDRYLNREIINLFKNVVKIVLKNPSLMKFFINTYKNQKSAAKLRLEWERKGVHVPPFLIFSITSKCNLSCAGCYAKSFKKTITEEMSSEKLQTIINEAHELGTSIILIAGGEPLIRKEIFQIISNYPDIIFPVFTNGILIDDAVISKMEMNKNFIPIISIEGNRVETDGRRGEGVFEYINSVIRKIKGGNIFWGVSLTLTCENYDLITGRDFIQNLLKAGCRIFFYVSYVPVKAGTESLCLNKMQEEKIGKLMNEYKNDYPAVFIAFPGGEDEMGGCLSSGRGFVHIGPDGSLEPCPFAPYSDTNLNDTSFRDALLNSKLLEQIRKNHDKLAETRGGCALWENREWVMSLIGKSKI